MYMYLFIVEINLLFIYLFIIHSFIYLACIYLFSRYLFIYLFIYLFKHIHVCICVNTIYTWMPRVTPLQFCQIKFKLTQLQSHDPLFHAKKKSPPHPKPLICFYLPPCFWFIFSTTRNGFPGAIQPPHLKVASTKAGPSLSGEASTDGKYVQLLGINVLPFVFFSN